jgi:phosphatidylglycerophosphatase A
MAKKKSRTRTQSAATPDFSRSVEAAAPAATTYVSPLRSAQPPVTTWYEIISTGFYSGYLPKAPGTWGSLFAALAFFLTARLLPSEGLFHIGKFSVSWWAALTGVFFTVVGFVASEKLANEWREKDPGEVVVDEFAGMFLACLLITPNAVGILAAFVFFRIFDVWKPGPIHSLQDLPGGRGIVLDDVLAGLAAAPLAWVVQFAVGKFFPGA